MEALLKLGTDPNATLSEDTKLTALHAAAMLENDRGFEIAKACMK